MIAATRATAAVRLTTAGSRGTVRLVLPAAAWLAAHSSSASARPLHVPSTIPPAFRNLGRGVF
jgi:hypothetical protein